MGESFASAAWDSFMLPTAEWFKAKVYVCECLYVGFCLIVCSSTTLSDTHFSVCIKRCQVVYLIEYLSCADVPSRLCRPTQRLRNMKMLLHSLSLWTASYKRAHIDTSATCMPTCVNTCVDANTSTLLQFFMFAYLDKHNLICKFIHTCKCTRGNSVRSHWRAHAVSPCSTQVSLKIHVQPHTQRRHSQTIYSMTHSCTCCCCHMLSVSLAHIRAEWEDRPSSLQHIHMCSRQACFHGNLRGKVLMKDFVIV